MVEEDNDQENLLEASKEETELEKERELERLAE